MGLKAIITLLVLHWIADFVLQTRQMADNKSTSIKWLSIHVLVYTLMFLVVGLKFAILTGVLHWITDFFTSKLTRKYYTENRIHAFFTIVGLDQTIHIVSLLVVYVLLH